MAGLGGIGACDAYLEREPFIEWIHRPIAAVGDACARGRKKAGRLHVFESRRPQILARALHRVRRLLFPLKREDRNHVQLLVAWEIRRVDDLIMSDGGADVAVREFPPQRADAVQAFTHGAIAVRMHMRLESRARRLDPHWAPSSSRGPEVYFPAPILSAVQIGGRA